MGDFHNIFKNLRMQNHYTQGQMADLLGISRSAVSMYETGNREPDLETLEKIAKFFNVDMNYLLGSSVTVTSDNPEPSYEDIEQMIARGSHAFSAAQKMKLIQLLSEIDL